jgi:uncharacterized protein (DUF433 family)
MIVPKAISQAYTPNRRRGNAIGQNHRSNRNKVDKNTETCDNSLGEGMVRINGGVREMGEFDRITFNPNVMGGRACIRGMRITVSLVLGLVAQKMSIAEIIDAYPYLESADIEQSLRYAAWLADESVLPTEVAAT